MVKSGGHFAGFQDEEYLEKLFNNLDVNKDGNVCVSDLLHAFEELNFNGSQKSKLEVANSFLSRSNTSKTGHLKFTEFVDYVLERDKKLVIAFDHLDRNNEGRVVASDIQAVFENYGMPLTKGEAENLVHRVDRSGTLYIDYNEWRTYLLFHPAEDISDILKFWRHDSCLDVGSDIAVGVPEDYSQTEKRSGRQLRQLVAGAAAGIVSRTFTAPIDRLKLMRQVHGYKHKGSSFVDAYRYMLREGGMSSLWRGNGINILKNAPETALKYGTYEHYKRFLVSPDNGGPGWLLDTLEDRPLLTKFLAGSLAGFTAQTIIYPSEVLKTRMCLRKTGQFASVVHCVRTVYAEGGFFGFYRGYFVNVLGIIPYAGIELALYERSKAAYIQRFILDNSSGKSTTETNSALSYFHQPPAHVIAVLAAFASSCGIIVSYPFQLIRSKMQMSHYSSTTHELVTASSLIARILQQDGIHGLYRGMFANLFKVLPAVSISFAMYEGTRRLFGLGPLGSG